MVYLLLGEDDFSRHQALQKIKRGIGDPALLEANTTTLDGQPLTLNALKTVCETLPFLAERRLVIARGLLERFEAKAKRGRQKKTSSMSNQQRDYEVWADQISKTPDSTILVLIDGGIKSNNPLLKALSGKAELMLFPRLKEAQLRQWIQKRVAEEGGTISPPAVALLAKLVGSNLWIMANEISKLILFASGRSIEEEDVQAVVSYAQEVNVFAMVDAILEFKAGVAEQALQQLLQRGAAPAYLLVVLSRQVQMMVRARELRNRRETEAEIQNRLGLTSEFALQKTLERAGRYTLERLREVYHRLLEADLSIKTGKYDGELALNILIAELCQKAGYRDGRYSPSLIDKD